MADRGRRGPLTTPALLSRLTPALRERRELNQVALAPKERNLNNPGREPRETGPHKTQEP
jgi:hypothetical protein